MAKPARCKDFTVTRVRPDGIEERWVGGQWLVVLRDKPSAAKRRAKQKVVRKKDGNAYH